MTTSLKKLCTCSTLFWSISLPLFGTTTTWNVQKLPGYTFYGRNAVRVLVDFFSLSLIFTLVAANISHFLTAATKFPVVPPTKNVSFVFSISLKLFFSLSFDGLTPYFLFFSIFLFLCFPNLWTWQLMQAKYFRQHGYKNLFLFPFSSLLTRSLSLLYKTQVAIHFPAKITWHLASAYMKWVYGRSAFVRYVITKFSCFHRLLIYLSNGTPPCTLRARELRH